MSMTVVSRALANGTKMPVLGLGTWKLREGDEAYTAVRTALDLGYRLIDTAKIYGNEHSIGKAVHDSNVPREEIFVTTKLWPTDFFHVENAFNESRKRLSIDYVDLYLIHWPIPLMPRSVWQSLERIYARGDSRAIGVSNYSAGELTKLLSYATIVPSVDQIRFNPYNFGKDVLSFCETHDIVLEAHSPLARGTHLNDPRIQSIARTYSKSPAQVLIRWCIQHNAVVIPKSGNMYRLRENADVFNFELSVTDMLILDNLS